MQSPAAEGIPPSVPAHLADRILRDRASLEGERRTVTVLFADAVGSTPIAAHIGEEEMYALMQGCFARMVEAVHHYEGHVAQFTGDGVMAVFGAPIAHEESERRAVAAALRMQRSLIAYSREVGERHPIDLRFRVGLNTGPVVVGRVSDELNMDFTAIGDTVNLAARMQQVAEPGAVYLTEATHRGVSDFFDCEPVGALLVKGREEPLATWRALRERPMRTRFEVAAQRGLAPFVGRDQELSVLEGHLDRVHQGRGHVIFLSGEAGIGKSRLLLEFQRRARAAEAQWLEGHCISYGRNIPYLPVIDLVKRAFGVEEGDDEARIVERVERGTERWDTAARSVTPYLRYLLSADPGDARVSGMDPRERRAGILDALRALLLQESRHGPLVAVIEDLHWIDEVSQAALAAVVDVVPSAPVLLVLTTRPGHQHPLSEQSYSTRLALDHLAPEESAALVRGVLGAASLPSELHALVAGKAEGNPFYTEEVVRSLLETGVIARSNGGYRLQRAVDKIRIPDTIQEVILARVDRLEREAKGALQLASVIGREFTVRLLDRISDLEVRLDNVLGELKALELIYQKAHAPELAYMFKHALTHDVAYSTLLRERRRALHRVVAVAVEELYADRLPEQYETLAHHYDEAGDLDKALHYLGLAAEKAAAAYANRDALGYYARALEVCGRLGEVADDTAAQLARRRSFINFGIGDFPAAVADSERAVNAARRFGDRSLEGMALAFRGFCELYNHDFETAEATLRTALAVGEEGFDEVRALAGLSLAVLVLALGRHPEADPFLAVVRQQASRLDPFCRGMLGWLEGRVELWQGRFDSAVRVLEERQAITEGYMFNRLFASWGKAHALGSRGDYEEALRVLEETIATCDRVGDVVVKSRCLNTVGWVHAEVLDLGRALEWNTRGVEFACGIHAPNREVEMNARINLGETLTALGRFEEARACFDEVEPVVRHPEPRDRWVHFRYSQRFFHSSGELLLAQGGAMAALAHADDCLRIAEHTRAAKNVAKARRLRGQALLAAGRADEAESELTAALVVAAEVGNPRQLWLCHEALGDLRRAQGRDADAGREYLQALAVVDRVAASLTDVGLRQTLLGSSQVRDLRNRANAASG